ncbi:SRPBCC family protein [Undibacterium sp. CY18W]|uniref:SRPBCC family protein n=1 Tax=Undibacterium hunanense TaxID=2762292 RepID=A0ABR6ZKT2_9BURK|nr:SRPBCC family protein [Undibacterium hunanense]MBC3916502.1 SRPBCC family protein [Undibacterium hunanense]
MKIIKWIAGILVTLVVVLLGIAYSLPNEYNISRSIVIQAPPAKIFPLIAAPKAWKNWSVWNQRDPSMEMQYSGPESGPGAAWDWKSKSQGNGGMKFSQVQTDQKLEYELHFEGMGKPSVGAMLLEVQAGGTKVTWDMHGSSEGNLMMKLFAPFMDKMVGPDFEAGLANLKKLAEKTT